MSPHHLPLSICMIKPKSAGILFSCFGIGCHVPPASLSSLFNDPNIRQRKRNSYSKYYHGHNHPLPLYCSRLPKYLYNCLVDRAIVERQIIIWCLPYYITVHHFLQPLAYLFYFPFALTFILTTQYLTACGLDACEYYQKAPSDIIKKKPPLLIDVFQIYY